MLCSHVWMWELDYKESWVPKNWCFWTAVLEKTFRVPWTARGSNQSILMEISPEYSLEGLMLTLQYFGHLMQRVNSLENTLMLGKTETEDWNGWMASPTQWIWVWANSRRQWRTWKPGVLQSMGSQRVRHDWVTEQFKTHIFSIYCLVKISTYYFVRKMIYLFKI